MLSMSGSSTAAATTSPSYDYEGFRDRVQKELTWSLQKLECDPSAEAVEQLGSLIFNSMTTPRRVYHAIPHVFDLITDAHKEDPIHILAALFHDIVYLAIDHQLSEQQASFLHNIVEEIVQPNGPSVIRWLGQWREGSLIPAVARIFDVEQNDNKELSVKGLNEYLSALITTNALEELVPLLSQRALFEIVVCIEATIPFRPILDGKTAMERLYAKATIARAEFLPNETKFDLVQSVQRAAMFANCDLRSFYSQDRNFFLDSSFKLLPESIPSLLTSDCLLADLRKAILGYYGLCENLDVQRIFCYFQGAPTPTVLEEMRRQAKDNMGLIYEYLTVRLLTISTVLTLLRQAGVENVRVSSYRLLNERVATTVMTPQPQFLVGEEEAEEEEQPVGKENQEILRLLVSGRHMSFGWDAATSPLDAMMYQQLGIRRVKEIVHQHVKAGPDPCDCELLKTLPCGMLLFLVEEMSELEDVKDQNRIGELKHKLGI